MYLTGLPSMAYLYCYWGILDNSIDCREKSNVSSELYLYNKAVR